MTADEWAARERWREDRAVAFMRRLDAMRRRGPDLPRRLRRLRVLARYLADPWAHHAVWRQDARLAEDVACDGSHLLVRSDDAGRLSPEDAAELDDIITALAVVLRAAGAPLPAGMAAAERAIRRARAARRNGGTTT